MDSPHLDFTVLDPFDGIDGGPQKTRVAVIGSVDDPVRDNIVLTHICQSGTPTVVLVEDEGRLRWRGYHLTEDHLTHFPSWLKEQGADEDGWLVEAEGASV